MTTPTAHTLAGPHSLMTLMGHVSKLTSFARDEARHDPLLWSDLQGSDAKTQIALAIMASYLPRDSDRDTPSLKPTSTLISRIKPTLSHALLARAHELTATDVIRDRDLFTAIFAAMDHDIISQEAGWVIAEGARVLYPDLYDVGSINFYALGETIQGIVNDIDKIKQGARGQPWQFAGQFLTQRGYITDVKELAHISSASELFDAYPVIRAELNRRVAAALLRFTDKTYLEHNFCIDEARIHAACRVGLIDKHFITTMDRQLARGKFLSSGIEPHLIRAGVWAGVTGAGLVSALSGLLRAKEINKVTEGIYGDWIALAMAIGGLVLTFIGVGMNTRALHRARDRADDLLK